ncbi:uncharacterized protein LOC132561040 [Ylistrum balloti]|uniref:uncharacterized protein LOC132561040 n=1 Tax=Ylistrum balloti TaxID=509963 RepID=UPI002905B9B0|nr:uncharacterized protein LOC132561040 [Ylistrum balloti]
MSIYTTLTVCSKQGEPELISKQDAPPLPQWKYSGACAAPEPYDAGNEQRYRSKNIYDLFMGNATFNSFVKEAQYLNNSFPDHYKSDIINYWNDMNITKVKVGVYIGQVQKAFFEFNALGCDKSEWFARSKLTNSSYTDLLDTNTRINFFSMEGGCSEDVGWFLVYDLGSRGVCAWEVDYVPETPAILFIPRSQAAVFSNERGNLRADFMTISAQFGSNSLYIQYILPASNFVNEEKTTTTSSTDPETLDEKVEAIKKELTVVKKATSAYKRTKVSAHDNRSSSKTIGTIAVLIIVTELLLIVLPDVVAMCRAINRMV